MHVIQFEWLNSDGSKELWITGLGPWVALDEKVTKCINATKSKDRVPKWSHRTEVIGSNLWVGWHSFSLLSIIVRLANRGYEAQFPVTQHFLWGYKKWQRSVRSLIKTGDTLCIWSQSSDPISGQYSAIGSAFFICTILWILCNGNGTRSLKRLDAWTYQTRHWISRAKV